MPTMSTEKFSIELIFITIYLTQVYYVRQVRIYRICALLHWVETWNAVMLL